VTQRVEAVKQKIVRQSKARLGWLLLVGALLTAGLLSRLGGAEGLGVFGTGPRDEIWHRIQTTRTLRVALDPSFPPFENLNVTTGELVGLDIDLAHEIARRLGVRADFVVMGYDSLYNALIHGRADLIISALPYDPARTRDVVYSRIYFHAGPRLVVPENARHIRDVNDLTGARVAVESSSDAEVEVRRLQRRLRLTVVPHATAMDALASVARGQADAAIVEPLAVYEFAEKQGGVRIAGQPLRDEPVYVIAVPLDSPLLLKNLNGVLDMMRDDGTLAQLRKKWLGAAD